MTTVELLQQAWANADSRMTTTSDPAALREFALAKTEIEVAKMRFTRGMAFLQGVQKDFDFEQVPTGSAT
jgi:hypothetical protein